MEHGVLLFVFDSQYFMCEICVDVIIFVCSACMGCVLCQIMRKFILFVVWFLEFVNAFGRGFLWICMCHKAKLGRCFFGLVCMF
jgi:hypothetical protein